MIASFVYTGSLVMAVLPIDSLKLMITVFFGTRRILVSRTAQSVMTSLVSAVYIEQLLRSEIEIHLFEPFSQYSN